MSGRGAEWEQVSEFPTTTAGLTAPEFLAQQSEAEPVRAPNPLDTWSIQDLTAAGPKRLTDGALLAEYWHQRFLMMAMPTPATRQARRTEERRLDTLARFATTRHYFEVPPL